MKSSLLATITLTIFLFVALFGLPMLLSHPEHSLGCPLQGAQTVMCENTVIEHVSMWQAMFASVVSSLGLLLGVALLVIAAIGDALLAHQRVCLRLKSHISERPTLFQELFSDGILNRKEPYAFS